MAEGFQIVESKDLRQDPGAGFQVEGREPEQPLPEPESQRTIPRVLGRIGVETAGALGASTLARPGGPVIMRAAEAGGAAMGSLLSEVFDPTESPVETAMHSAGMTLATGAAFSTLTTLGRMALGKPSAAGELVEQIMTRLGKVPPPGVVLESEFLRNMQSYGSAAFFNGGRIESMLTDAAGAVTSEGRAWIRGFQQYHDLAQTAFKEVDKVLPYTGHGLHMDKATMEALRKPISIYRSEGVSGNMPSVLQKAQFGLREGVEDTKITFKEAQDAATALFSRARALEVASKIEPTKTGGTNVAKEMRDRAMDMRRMIDGEVDKLIASKGVPADTKLLLTGAREKWAKWQEGEELTDIFTAATRDVAEGGGTVSGSKLITNLDKVLKEQEAKGITLISKEAAENMQRYGKALENLEKAGQASGFQFVARGQQIAGLAGMATGFALPGGLAVTAPHVVSFLMSNKTAANIMLRGLTLDPGSAAAARASRELLTLMMRERVLEPQRIPRTDTPAAMLRLRQRAMPDETTPD